MSRNRPIATWATDFQQGVKTIQWEKGTLPQMMLKQQDVHMQKWWTSIDTSRYIEKINFSKFIVD